MEAVEVESSFAPAVVLAGESDHDMEVDTLILMGFLTDDGPREVTGVDVIMLEEGEDKFFRKKRRLTISQEKVTGIKTEHGGGFNIAPALGDWGILI